ncbi:hypothetical protein BD324DRAFT_612053 [Kockovaella imperatae]|uniref:RNI-like protein n=1 Tax=Kockovaella imperatae TaxID=4999 RepID=A0A1Y1UT09_9TREE|nr:hypothetical protein BD324DRAFT_612053 [Kockovaella imperatae]ORX40767.1 hypothetical protein BD324DRAFT_612053 [Kockovaella imperatae]
MAVVFRSTSDLLYLPDHGFVEEDGAIKILLQINRQIRRLDVSHNLLGNEGISVLIQGLNSCRHRFSSTDYGLWGLRDINLGSNSISDESFSALMSYAKKDVFMRRVTVQGNDIELRNHLDSVLNSLNSSHIEDLSLTNNPSLLSSSIRKLFNTITTPYLSQLYLSVCNLGPNIIPPLVSYLGSPRSRNLELLELNGNKLGVEGVRAIVDVVESFNFTIKEVSLLANDVLSRSNDDVEETSRPSDAEKRAENDALAYECHRRLPPLLARNRALTQRIRRAAIRVIAPARILLTARPLNDVEMARQVIDSIGTRPPAFRILDLPREVLYLIVRHCSRDASAFSEAQFTRMRKEAESRDNVKRNGTIMRERLLKAESDQIGRAVWQVREEWLKKGKWDKWELDKPVQVPAHTETVESHSGKSSDLSPGTQSLQLS